MRNLVFTAAPWVFSNRRYTLEFFDLVIRQYSNFLKLSVFWLADISKIQVPCNDFEFSLDSYSVRFSTERFYYWWEHTVDYSILLVLIFWSQVVNLMTGQWRVLSAGPLRDHLDPVYDVFLMIRDISHEKYNWFKIQWCSPSLHINNA